MRGFGFIEQEGGGDVFVHYSNIGGDGFKTLEDGEKVSLTSLKGQKGLQAQKVTLASPPKNKYINNILEPGRKQPSPSSLAQFFY